MKKLVTSVLIASMALGLVACGSNGNTGSNAGTAVDGTEAGTPAATTTSTDTGALKINLASEPDYLDPAKNSSVDGGCLAVNTFVGLYTYDAEGNLIPALGEATVSEDGTVYTFTMIESQWSNGDAVTANDFIYSWERVVAEETASDYAYLFDIIARNEDGSMAMEATDDYTLVVTLTNPCPYFLDLTAFPTFMPVHQASVEAANPDGTNPAAWAQEAGFVCNGAYTLSAWAHGESMVYEKNPNFYDAANVGVEQLEFMLSADDTAIYAAYNSGDLDFIDTVPTDEIQALLSSPEFYIIDNLGTYYISFNVNDSMFEGKTPEQANDMRHAISLLIDRQYIVDNVAQCGQIPADSFISPGMADGNGSEFKTADISYYDATTTGAANVEEAKALLEGAGYSFTDKGDGSYSISPALGFEYIINESTLHQQTAESVQQDLAVLGIEVSIKTEEWQTFLNDRKTGNFGVARDGWLADYNDPINMLEIYTSDSGNNNSQLGKNVASAAPQNWSEYDALIKEIRTTADFAARVGLMHQAEDMLMDTWAAVPIYFYNDLYMQKSNVTGVYSTVYGMKYFMYAEKN